MRGKGLRDGGEIQVGSISSFLSGFSGSFKAALLIWPFLSFALTLPVLVYLYHRDGRLRLSSAVAAYLTILYIAGLGCFTLYPLPSGDAGPGITYGIPPQFDPLNFVHDIAKDGIRAVLQLLFNVVLFVPLGFIAKRFLRLGFGVTVLISLGTTILIETAQLTGLFGIYPYAYRTFEVDDIICNTLGGVIGWLCACGLGRVLPEERAIFLKTTHDPGFVRRCVALWVDLMIIALCTEGPWLLLALASEALLDEPFTIAGLTATQTEMLMMYVCFALSCAVFEVVVPWCNDGSTVGGKLVHMSFETRKRTGAQRVLFYVVRAAALIAILMFPLALVPVIVIFYLIARKMPYDYLPGQ